MEKFIVSARKYRPQTFETVVGQSHITTTLKNAIRHQQLAHAFLFCGPRGVGKTTCARILAKTINCENITAEGEACDQCQSCISFNDGASMNYFELDAASNNSVDNIRDLVDQVRFVPQTGKYKVYVIDEVHMLSQSAFNAFLKTLEEPPSYAIFILATTEKHKILPTILSRCQIFDFRRINTIDTVHHLEEICLKEDIKADKTALQVIAQKSEGCMRDALSILDKIVSFTNGELNYANTLEHLNILDADFYFKFLSCMQQQDLSGALLLYDDINRKGFEGDIVMNGFAEFIRNLLVCKDEKAAVLLEVVENLKEKYIQTSKLVSPSILISSLNILNESELNYKAARNKRLHVELCLIKLCYLQQAIEVSSGENTLSKKKQQDKPQAFRTASIKLFSNQPVVKNKKEEPAKLVVEIAGKHTADNTVEKKSARSASSTAASTVLPTGKLSALDKIRKQYQEIDKREEVNQPLELNELKAAWQEYVISLKETRNPAAQPFELAVLRIKDESSFEAVTTNPVEKQFIEQSRNKLFSFLQERLKNKNLRFTVVIEENNTDKPITDIPLSASQQYQKMVEMYPQIKDLKDKLNLSLDY
jgi:DNA polymerase-3 subunit gamma/tau